MNCKELCSQAIWESLSSGSNEGDEKIQYSTTVTCPFDIESIVDKAKALQLEDPVETLRFLQLEISQGRALDMSVFEETLEGEANMITVNPGAVLQSTFSELEFIDNYRLPFSVDFMGKECEVPTFVEEQILQEILPQE